MSISHRKADHIQLCIDGDVGFKTKTNLFDDIDLLHNALPEMHLQDVDLSSSFAGQPLQAPLFIAAMTGGVDRAEQINNDLASVAQELGIGFAFGSQRPLLCNNITEGYMVRGVAPTVPLLGNIGLVQAAEASTEQLEEMVYISGVNALCVHLNPAMEVVQPEGDEDFRGGIDCLTRLVEELSVPIVVKETGCGISRHVATQVKALGIQYIDVSGAGGTSWVAVEAHRAAAHQKTLGERYWDWGIPTAASVAQLHGLDLGICATGGIQDGLMVVKALALGASCGGMARVVLQAYAEGGKAGAKAFLEQTIQEIRVGFLLCGARNLQALQSQPLIVGPRLNRWIPKDSTLRNRFF